MAEKETLRMRWSLTSVSLLTEKMKMSLSESGKGDYTICYTVTRKDAGMDGRAHAGMNVHTRTGTH